MSIAWHLEPSVRCRCHDVEDVKEPGTLDTLTVGERGSKARGASATMLITQEV